MASCTQETGKSELIAIYQKCSPDASLEKADKAVENKIGILMTKIRQERKNSKKIGETKTPIAVANAMWATEYKVHTQLPESKVHTQLTEESYTLLVCLLVYIIRRVLH